MLISVTPDISLPRVSCVNSQWACTRPGTIAPCDFSHMVASPKIASGLPMTSQSLGVLFTSYCSMIELCRRAQALDKVPEPSHGVCFRWKQHRRAIMIKLTRFTKTSRDQLCRFSFRMKWKKWKSNIFATIPTNLPTPIRRWFSFHCLRRVWDWRRRVVALSPLVFY